MKQSLASDHSWCICVVYCVCASCVELHVTYVCVHVCACACIRACVCGGGGDDATAVRGKT